MDWDNIIDTHGATFILYAKRLTRSHADAEDVVQTAIMRLCKSCHGKKDIPLGWIYRTIRYTALDYLKSKQRRYAREENATDTLYPEKLFETKPGETISDEAETALGKLSEDQKEVVIMKVWGGLTFREIADSLNIPANTAASRYRYAMNTLRSALIPHSPGNEKENGGILI